MPQRCRPSRPVSSCSLPSAFKGVTPPNRGSLRARPVMLAGGYGRVDGLLGRWGAGRSEDLHPVTGCDRDQPSHVRGALGGRWEHSFGRGFADLAQEAFEVEWPEPDQVSACRRSMVCFPDRRPYPGFLVGGVSRSGQAGPAPGSLLVPRQLALRPAGTWRRDSRGLGAIRCARRWEGRADGRPGPPSQAPP